MKIRYFLQYWWADGNWAWWIKNCHYCYQRPGPYLWRQINTLGLCHNSWEQDLTWRIVGFQTLSSRNFLNWRFRYFSSFRNWTWKDWVERRRGIIVWSSWRGSCWSQKVPKMMSLNWISLAKTCPNKRRL